ncbi:MAG: carboxy terminal-processing peptidase [Sphingobacteriaceae bacterium]|nr:carboxy terminal-processing peptidase [Sphingobacteriaceae bacterium]
MSFKKNKEMLKKVLLVGFTMVMFACNATPKIQKMVEGVNNIKPDVQQGIVIKEVVSLIENYSFKKIVVNDSISSLILDKYINTLDPSKQYFLASDIKEFEGFRYTLDDEFRAGELTSAFYIFNVYLKRYKDGVSYSLLQVNTKFDYNTKDIYTYDRSKLPWIAAQSGLDSLWRKKINYELVSLKIAEPRDSINVKTVKKRYEDLQSQASKMNNQDVFQLIMNSLTAAFDPHTNYFNPVNAQRFNEDMSRSMQGIGARLQLENEVVKIISLIAGGPAAKSKLLNVGDKIVGVGQGVDGELENVIGWRLDNIVAKIKGPKGTFVRLKIIPEGQQLTAKPKIITLGREKIVIEEASAKKEVNTIKRNGKTYKIGVIVLPDFYMDFAAANAGEKDYKSTTRDVRRLIDTLKTKDKVDAIVMDLRSNGGGSLTEAINLTGLFIEKGPVVQVKNLGGRIDVNEDKENGIAWGGPLTVMVDRFSASASEIFAGAIQDYGRGIIVGTQTYGKGTVQQQLSLNNIVNPSILEKLVSLVSGKDSGPVILDNNGKLNLGQINLTTAKFYRVTGSSTQHKGVMPDVNLPAPYDLTKFGESSEPSALPWDEIGKSDFKIVSDLSLLKTKLVKAHQLRMHKSVDYRILKEDIEEEKKQDKKTFVSLNQEKLKQERDSLELVNLAKKNKLRVAKGLKPIKKGDKNFKEYSFDLIKNENLEIATDLIEATKAK